MGTSQYNIFISHRMEDHAIASAVSGALRLLSDNKLEPFVCKDIPGGTEWRDWIEKKIKESHFMLFLYTVENFDWRWCFYEIGLFRRPGESNPRPIFCIRNPSIESLPSPLEKYQAYQATATDVKRFLEDLLYKGEFTDGDRINAELFNDNKYLLAIKDFLKVFEVSNIERKFYARRAKFDLKGLYGNESNQNNSGLLITSDSHTMGEILLTTGQSTHWQNLYRKFKAAGQSTWLDQIMKSIENIKKENNPTFIMKPFSVRNNKKFIPVLTRVEQMPSEDKKTIIPLKIYVIFIPCSDVEETCDFIDISNASDPKFLLEMWQTILPTSVIRIQWKRKSKPIRYSEEDMIGLPVVYAVNPSFADLYNFNYKVFPDPDGNKPLTSGDLLSRVEEFIVDSETYIPKIMEDQAELSRKIIFEGSNAFAEVPLKFNDKHPCYPNSSYLPCLVSKNTVGDTNGPHVTYLGVVYARGDWAV